MTERRTVVAASASDWEVINQLAIDFADGMIRETALRADDFVRPEGELVYGNYPTVVVHVQMQNQVRSVRLAFTGVRSINYNYNYEHSPAEARDLPGGTWEVRVLELTVVAEMCRASLVGEGGLGEGPFVLADVPDTDSGALDG